MTTYSIDAQLSEIDTELAYRADVFPRMVANRKMKQDVAAYRTGAMQQARATLQWCKENRAFLAWVKANEDRLKLMFAGEAGSRGMIPRSPTTQPRPP